MSRKTIEDFSLLGDETTTSPSAKRTKTSKRISKPSSPAVSPQTSSSGTPESQPPVAPLSTSSSGVPDLPTRSSRFAGKVATQVEEATQADLEFRQALRNLEPLLSEQEKQRYRHLLRPELTAELYQRQSELRKSYG